MAIMYHFFPGAEDEVRFSFLLIGSGLLLVIIYVIRTLRRFERIHLNTLKKWEHSDEELIPLETAKKIDDMKSFSYSLGRDAYLEMQKGKLKDKFKFYGYDKLVGDWDMPVFTPEEAKLITGREYKYLMKFGFFIFIIGLIPIITFTYDIPILRAFLGCGIWIFLVGITWLLIFYFMNRSDVKNPRYKTTVSWKNTSPKLVKQTLEQYLEERGEPISEEPISPTLLNISSRISTRYCFLNKNFIDCTYNEGMDWIHPGTLSIDYSLEYPTHAREIQKELDALLTEKDLIFRYREKELTGE